MLVRFLISFMFLAFYALAFGQVPKTDLRLDSTVGVSHRSLAFNVYLVESRYDNLNKKRFNPTKDRAILLLADSFKIDWQKAAKEFVVVGGGDWPGVTLSLLPSPAPHTSLSPDKIKFSLYPSWNTVVVIEYFMTDNPDSIYLTVYGRRDAHGRDAGVERFGVIVPRMKMTIEQLGENGDFHLDLMFLKQP